MENLTPSTNTVGVSYYDPDATYSSSDEGSGESKKRSKKKFHEMEVECVEKNQDPRSDSGDFQQEMGFKKQNMMSEREQMVGVRTMRSGKFWAEIKDPIKRGWVWPGVFGTAEAASRAYLAQKSKFLEAKLRAEQRGESAASQNSLFQDFVVLESHSPPTSAGKKIEGVSRTNSGKFSASIKDPFKRKQVHLGSFTTAEEASRAYLAKKAQIEANKLRVQKLQFVAKMLRDKRRIDEVASTLQASVSSVSTSDLTSFHGGGRTRISDVRRTRHGKFSAAITDPITKRLVYIGTFATEEEAYRACLTMEAEFAAEKLIAPVTSDKSTFQDSVSSVLGNCTSDSTSFWEGARTRISDVWRTNSGEFSAGMTEPIARRRAIGTFATGTAEVAASRADPAQESKFASAKLRAKQAASHNPPLQDLVPSVLDSHNPQTSAGKKIEGVLRMKSGKFGASIKDPFKKKKVCLGSFTTAEEASWAYLAKKAQIEAKQLRVEKARLEAKMLRANRRISSGKPTIHGGARTRISGVYRTSFGKFTAQISNPITKRRVWIGTFPTKQKASRAYRAKEAEFEEEFRAKQLSERESLAPGPVSSVFQIETSDLSNETGVVESIGENKVSGDQEAGFGFFNGVQVVDRNGFLVGDFSILDDFSI